MEYFEMLDVIKDNPNINAKAFGLTEEQLAGIDRPLPDLNKHIDFNLVKRRIETLRECNWFNFKAKRELKILNKLYATKKESS
jgi:hypothetical protein